MKRPFLMLLATILSMAAGCGNGSAPSEPDTGGAVTIPDDGSATFAVFGNTGVATDDGDAFDRLVAGMNGSGLDFAVDIGNCLPPGTPTAGTGVIRDTVDNARGRIAVPVYPVAGPLDIFDTASARTYQNRYGPLWYAFTGGGVRFIVLDTEDGACAEGFGDRPRLGSGQLDWLEGELDTLPGDMPVVLVMNRPLWDDAPDIWHDRLLPMLSGADVVLAVSCHDGGLRDWGVVDGIRAVSTGCTGPDGHTGPGSFPHALIVTINGRIPSFGVLGTGGSITGGLPVTSSLIDRVSGMARALAIPALDTDPGFTVSETATLTVANSLGTAIEGTVAFTVAPGTLWDIRPPVSRFAIEPGGRETIHVQIDGAAPELAPLPTVHVTAEINGVTIMDREEDIVLAIPPPRTGEVVTVKATVPEVVPWTFDGSGVTVPVDIGSIDTCGRLIIYRENGGPVPECIYVSPLVDFRPGLAAFTWDGRDLAGEPVTGGDLVFYLFAYNKEAPVTWVANGPPSPGGTITVQRGLAGPGAETHTSSALISYPFDESITGPEPVVAAQAGSLLGGLELTGFARGDDGRVYLGTQRGILCTVERQGSLVPDGGFGDGGYLRLPDLRSRILGPPVWRNGRLYLGAGGATGGGPLLMLFDGVTGKTLSRVELGAYFGVHEAPPAVTVTRDGIYLAHPDEGLVMHLTHYGDILWVNDSGDTRIGAVDADGRSFTHHVGVDQYGFAYVNTPGTSARCGVLGPDGRGLFRVILVQVPGLRVAQTIPLVEGRDTDGLYFVTSGATQPYVFHVPFTIRRGRIAPAAETIADDGGGTAPPEPEP